MSDSAPATAAPKPAALAASPMGRKNMLATQCSKPITTNAATGRMMPSTLSAVVRAPKPIHTARQTSRLHSTPLKNSVCHAGVTLPTASDTIASPTEPPPMLCRSAKKISAAIARAPTKLPSHTTLQLRARPPDESCPTPCPAP